MEDQSERCNYTNSLINNLVKKKQLENNITKMKKESSRNPTSNQKVDQTQNRRNKVAKLMSDVEKIDKNIMLIDATLMQRTNQVHGKLNTSNQEQNKRCRTPFSFNRNREEHFEKTVRYVPPKRPKNIPLDQISQFNTNVNKKKAALNSNQELNDKYPYQVQRTHDLKEINTSIQSFVSCIVKSAVKNQFELMLINNRNKLLELNKSTIKWENEMEEQVNRMTQDLFITPLDRQNFNELKNFVKSKNLECTEKDMITIFNYLDRDGDGYINVDQLYSLVEPYIKKKKVYRKLMAIFTIMDYNSNGSLNPNKICLFLHSIGFRTINIDELDSICAKVFRRNKNEINIVEFLSIFGNLE